MKPIRALLVIGGVTLIAGLNLVAVVQSGLGPKEAEPAVTPTTATEQGPRTLSWKLLQQTKVTPVQVKGEQGLSMDFPSELRALAQTQTRVEGAGFLLRQNEKGPIERFAIMPASLQSCCGPACTPSLNSVVLVDCSKHPIPRALWTSGGRIAAVEGSLRLGHADDLGCAFGLTEARVRLFDPSGKVVVYEGLAGSAGPPPRASSPKDEVHSSPQDSGIR